MTSLSVLALATTLMHSQQQTIEPRLLRQPDIHGNTVVFIYGGDLWASTTDGGSVARRIASNVGARTGNAANKPYASPHISPDGKWVAYIGNYDGTANIYVVSIDGGEPKRVTYNNGLDLPLGWTPDGRIAYSTSEGVPYLGRQSKLMYVSPKGGVPQDTPIKEIASLSFYPGGDKIAYNRFNSFNFNWRRYRGGTQGKISTYDFKTNKYEELPSKREQSYWPMVVGDSIYYISDRANGTLNLYKNSGGKDTQLTKFSDADIRFPSTDGENIVYERDGFLYQYSIKNNTDSKINVRVPSENLASRPGLKNLAPYISDFALSPSGVRVAVAARGEVFSVPAKSGETRNMSNSSGSREKSVDWSPDGKWITYLSDKNGEWELYSQPQAGGEAQKLTDGTIKIASYIWSPDSKKVALFGVDTKINILDVETKKIVEMDDLQYGGGGFSFSNDGKWTAYCKGKEGGFKTVVLYEVATGKKQNVSDGFFDDSDVCFDKGGKWLFFSSSRVFAPTYGRNEFSLKVEETERLYAVSLKANTPNPFLDKDDEEPDPAKKEEKKEDGPKGPDIDFAGIENRIIALPMGVSSYGGMTSADNGFFYVSNGVLFQYVMGAKAPTPIYEGIGPFAFNPSRSKIAVMVPGGIQVLTVQPGLNGQTPGRIDLSNVEAVIDPREEWRQILVDAWRYERDNFYDPNMNGVDWNAILKKYEGYLEWVNHRTDLNYILGMMIGELGTGHAYVQGAGDLGAPTPRIQVGSLCADFEVFGGGVRFKKIIRGSNDFEQYQTPLGLPGIDVKEGEYLVAIDGKPVTADVNPNQFLLGKVGKSVTLSINSTPSMEGARKVRVKPSGNDTMARYYEFIEGNRKKVSQLSGGRIGYMHIQNTAAEGSSDFVRGFYSQTDKEAMLVDERWNGGGYIQPWFVDTLSRKKKAMIQPRWGANQPEAPTIEGPMALMINQYAGSGGDFFPYMFKQAKRGPLIGKRTWGGLVGINGGYTLVDGGNLTAPAFSIYNPETGDIIAENMGIDPDIDIDMRPDLVAEGRDPQLEAAVKYLMDELAKLPAKKNTKIVPKVGKNGKINP